MEFLAYGFEVGCVGHVVVLCFLVVMNVTRRFIFD